MNEKEFIALVDADDAEVSARKLCDAYADGLMDQARAVVLFVVNDNGDFWIPKTTKQNTVFPDMLMPSVLGFAMPGQTYHEAIKKQAFEQLGIDPDKHKFKELDYISPQDSCGSFVTMYQVKFNLPCFDNDPEKYTQCSWLSIQDIKELEKKKVAMHPFLIIGLKKFFDY